MVGPEIALGAVASVGKRVGAVACGVPHGNPTLWAVASLSISWVFVIVGKRDMGALVLSAFKLS